MAQEWEDDSMMVELDAGYKELTQNIQQQINSLKNVESKQMREMIEKIKNDLKECGMTVKFQLIMMIMMQHII